MNAIQAQRLAKEKNLSHKHVKECFHYEPSSGKLTWKISKARCVKIGQEAGWMRSDGYRQVEVDGTKFLVHRLIYFFIEGKFPPKEIDHIDGNKSNNRWNNIRACSRSENMSNAGPRRNNKLGIRGVYYDPKRRRYITRIRKGCTKKYIGSFKTKEEAARAYQEEQSKIFGEYAYPGETK